jgi:hypothetical protein
MIDGTWPIWVVDENGHPEYECLNVVENGSNKLPYIKLEHLYTGEQFDLSGTKEELKIYFEETSEKSQKIMAQANMVESDCEKDQYGGVFYDRGKQEVCAYITDDTVEEKLTEQGIKCLKSKISMDDLEGELQQIWNEKEELGINYVHINEKTNGLDIYTANVEKTKEWLEPRGDIEYIIEETDDVSSLDGILGQIYIDADEQSLIEIKDKLEMGLIKLKQTYPDYDDRNLLLRISSDGNTERYLDFPNELLEYVDSLPAYEENAENPFEEMMFGDPERIEIKSLLREYKELYPQMEYSEIYEKYLLHWEKSDSKNASEKWVEMVAKRKFGELSRRDEIVDVPASTEKKIEINGVVIVSMVLVGGILIFIAGNLLIKRKIKKVFK